MKLTLKDIKDSERILSQILMAQVEFKLAYRIEKITNKLVKIIEQIEDFRLDLVKKFGQPEKDKDGKDTGRLSVPPEKHEEFNKAFIDYLVQDSDLDCQEIPYELLENSGIKVSPADMTTLKKFIAEPVVPGTATVTRIVK
jgi:hypothetical protein